MNCINCGAPVNAKGACEHCGTIAKGVRDCSDCPGNRHNFKVIQTSIEQVWYKPGTEEVVRRFRVWDDGVEQGMEEVDV